MAFLNRSQGPPAGVRRCTCAALAGAVCLLCFLDRYSGSVTASELFDGASCRLGSWMMCRVATSPLACYGNILILVCPVSRIHPCMELRRSVTAEIPAGTDLERLAGMPTYMISGVEARWQRTRQVRFGRWGRLCEQAA